MRKFKYDGKVVRVIDVDTDIERVPVEHRCDTKSLRGHKVDSVLNFNNEIDWEQRRYELAKEAMGAFISSPNYQFNPNCNYYESQVCATADVVARDAVYYADALISKLRNANDRRGDRIVDRKEVK